MQAKEAAGPAGKGKKMIPHDTWHLIEIIIRRYPAQKKEYRQYISEIMESLRSAQPEVAASEDYSRPQSVTEAKALKMTSPRAERMKREIEAVELTYKSLGREEQKLMAERFWSDQKRNVPYTKIDGVGYSERQMRRIVKKIILRVGVYLGEI